VTSTPSTPRPRPARGRSNADRPGPDRRGTAVPGRRRGHHPHPGRPHPHPHRPASLGPVGVRHHRRQCRRRRAVRRGHDRRRAGGARRLMRCAKAGPRRFPGWRDGKGRREGSEIRDVSRGVLRDARIWGHCVAMSFAVLRAVSSAVTAGGSAGAFGSACSPGSGRADAAPVSGSHHGAVRSRSGSAKLAGGPTAKVDSPLAPLPPPGRSPSEARSEGDARSVRSADGSGDRGLRVG